MKNRIIPYCLRVILFACFIFFFGISLIASTDLSQLASKAEADYKEARFSHAIVLYDSLLKMGYEDGRLYYNLGNAHFKTGHMAQAKLFYEKAQTIAPDEQDILHNIAVVDARLVDRVESVPQLFVVRWWNDLKDYNSVRTLFLWSVLFVALIAAVIVVYYWWMILWVRRIAFFSGIFFIILFACNVFILLDKIEDYSAHRMAIVMENTVTARSTPDKSGVEAFTIHEGLKVEVVDHLEQWLKIRLSDGKTGWLISQSIERI